ncbi:MAG: trypsin-like serine protease, partial [Myxococcota bacterium]
SDHDGDEGERLLIVEDWQMPNYLETFDIGLFALERPATTPPVRLLRTCDVPSILEDGVEATILGYGATDLEGREPTTRLHRAVITIDDADCDDLERGCRSAVSPGGELRAGGDGVDTCIGDSGGPLFVEGPDGPVLAGITSRSALPAPTDCGNGGIYVRVDAILDWVEETSGRSLAGAPCEPPSAADTASTGDTGTPPDRDRCGCVSAPGIPWELGLAAWLSVVARGRGRRARRATRRHLRG